MSTYSAAHYAINQRIDAPIRLLGLTLDEAIPVIILVASGFLFNFQLISIVVAMMLVTGLKRLKKGQGMPFLLSWLTWHIDASMSRLAFRKTPASSDRFWLK